MPDTAIDDATMQVEEEEEENTSSDEYEVSSDPSSDSDLDPKYVFPSLFKHFVASFFVYSSFRGEGWYCSPAS